MTSSVLIFKALLLYSYYSFEDLTQTVLFSTRLSVPLGKYILECLGNMKINNSLGKKVAAVG